MKLTILGQGAWGQALGHVFTRAGHEISFWSRGNILQPAEAYVLAIPAQSMRHVLQSLNLQNLPLICAAKGIEQATGLTMAEVAKTVCPTCEFYALSGPSFAADVIAGLPTAVSLAGPTLEKAADLAKLLSIQTFRIYPTDDVKGVELGGSMKNVLAIACGISDGQGLGESARASLVTRGFAELMRFAKAQGARPETLMGLSGFGDLQLTCTSTKSRNYSYGLAIGRGNSPAQALDISKGVVEGAFTASIAESLAQRQNIDMPIIKAVANIVEGRSDPQKEIANLLARPVRAETI